MFHLSPYVSFIFTCFYLLHMFLLSSYVSFIFTCFYLLLLSHLSSLVPLIFTCLSLLLLFHLSSNVNFYHNFIYFLSLSPPNLNQNLNQISTPQISTHQKNLLNFTHFWNPSKPLENFDYVPPRKAPTYRV